MLRRRCPATPSTSIAVVPALLVALVGLAGCSSGEPDAPMSSGPVTPAVGSATPAPTGTTVADKGGVGAHKDLTSPSCTVDAAGVWSFTGSVANPEKSAQRYTVELSVVDPNGWSVIGSKDVEVTVPAGKTAPVAAKAFFTEKKADAAKHQCVTRVVRHPA